MGNSKRCGKCKKSGHNRFTCPETLPQRQRAMASLGLDPTKARVAPATKEKRS